MGAASSTLAIGPRQPFMLAGSELFRLNRQACHGPDSIGSPQAISLGIGPVQGTSAARLLQEFRRHRVQEPLGGHDRGA